MGAECDKHGVDLHGDTFSGLVCPVCEAEKETREAERHALERVLHAAGEEWGFSAEDRMRSTIEAFLATTPSVEPYPLLRRAERERDDARAALVGCREELKRVDLLRGTIGMLVTPTGLNRPDPHVDLAEYERRIARAVEQIQSIVDGAAAVLSAPGHIGNKEEA